MWVVFWGCFRVKIDRFVYLFIWDGGLWAAVASAFSTVDCVVSLFWLWFMFGVALSNLSMSSQCCVFFLGERMGLRVMHNIAAHSVSKTDAHIIDIALMRSPVEHSFVGHDSCISLQGRIRSVSTVLPN